MDQFEVVCIDDEESILTVYNGWLSGEGFRVVSFENPLAALDYISENSSRIGLVICDYRMPELNGVEVRRQFRGRMEQIPFAIVSGHITFDMLDGDIKHSIVKYIAKPFRIEELGQLARESFFKRKLTKDEEESLICGFVEEARLKMDEAEDVLLKLDREDSDKEACLRSFARIVHTLKGASACISLNAIEQFAHDVESSMTPYFEMKDVPTSYLSALFTIVSGFRRMLDEALENGRPQYDPVVWRGVFNCTDNYSPLEPPKMDLIGSSIRKIPVAIEDLDRFTESSGNLVILRNYVLQRIETLFEKYPGEKIIGEIIENLHEMQKENSLLQNRVGELRKVPFSEVARPLRRLVRDLSHQLKKDVHFEISDETIRIEITMATVIGDVLIHMLRNSLDHGIESSEERIKSGKPAVAKIRLDVTERNDALVISLSDDGRGINVEKIRNKIIEKQLADLSYLRSLSDDEIRQWIFHPGFSTADKVSEVSGRGIGMDMVRNMVLSMKGQIQVVSQIGLGTELIIRMPTPKMTDIRRAVTFRAKDLSIAILCDDISEIGDSRSLLEEKRLNRVRDKYFLLIDNNQIQVNFLHLVLSDNRDRPHSEVDPIPALVVSLNMGRNRFCFFADSMSNTEDLLIRKLPSEILGDSPFSSVAVSGHNGLLVLFDSDSYQRFSMYGANRVSVGIV